MYSQSDKPEKFLFNIGLNFHATPEEIDFYEEEILEGTSIAYFEEQIDRLIDSEEIVISSTKIHLLISYPLRNSAIFEVSNSNEGFTRRKLIEEICKKYKEIYIKEESSSSIKTLLSSERGELLNRNETQGFYGIWGHDLEDLVLNGMDVYENESGQILLRLRVSS
jgi:hypothetical protein